MFFIILGIFDSNYNEKVTIEFILLSGNIFLVLHTRPSMNKLTLLKLDWMNQVDLEYKYDTKISDRNEHMYRSWIAL